MKEMRTILIVHKCIRTFMQLILFIVSNRFFFKFQMVWFGLWLWQSMHVFHLKCTHSHTQQSLKLLGFFPSSSAFASKHYPHNFFITLFCVIAFHSLFSMLVFFSPILLRLLCALFVPLYLQMQFGSIYRICIHWVIRSEISLCFFFLFVAAVSGVCVCICIRV